MLSTVSPVMVGAEAASPQPITPLSASMRTSTLSAWRISTPAMTTGFFIGRLTAIGSTRLIFTGGYSSMQPVETRLLANATRYRDSSRQRWRTRQMATSQRTCPDCGAEVPVHEGLRTWCERCDWNVGTDTQLADEGFFARQYVRIGERYGKAMLETLKLMPVQNLRPRWTTRKCSAFLL